MNPLGLAVVALAAVWSDARPLTTAQAVRELSPDDAGRGRLVVLTGVVTHANPHIDDLFLYDDTAGIYLAPGLKTPLPVGTRIEVRGVSARGSFAPCVEPRAVRALGPGRLPDPFPYNLDRNDSRWLDAQPVQVQAVAGAAVERAKVTNLTVRTTHGTGTLVFPGTGILDRLRPLDGAAVRVRGVCVPWFDPATRAVVGPPRVFVASPDAVVVLPRPTPTASPPLLVEHLDRFVPSLHPLGRQVKAVGTVVGVYDPTTLFVQGRESGVCVRTVRPVKAAVGDEVEAVGELEYLGPRAFLTGATVRAVGPADPPAPAPRPIDELSAGRHFGTLVSVVATVVESRADDRLGRMVTLRQGASRFELLLPHGADPGPLLALPTDARVRAVGVHRSPADGGGGFLLLARSAADLTVLELPPPPPWWTPQRVAAVGGGLLGVVVIGTTWVVLLRRQVRRQTAEIRARFAREAELEGRLVQAARMEALGRLAGGVAHDFNNLLTVINGCGELLGELLPPDHPTRPLAADMRKAGERAADLTRQLLLFSRQREVALAPLDVSAVIGEAARLVGRLAGERVKVVTELVAGLPAVRADAGLLSQVLVNLAVNARDAMPGGGTLTVTTAAGESGRVRLTVTDTGVGMPPEVQARVFEPFFTTKPVGQGTGLGLATVYGIVKTLGGSIRVQSAVGAGTTFVIDLPPADGPPSGLATRPPAVGPVAGRVLVVEDDAAVRGLAARVLTEVGYAVRAVGAAADADRLAADRPFDVLLADVQLPGEGGIRLAQRLKERWPGLRVLLMTGYPQDDGAGEVLVKPFTPAELRAAIGRALAGSAAEL